MSRPITVFICHKKTIKSGTNATASFLHAILQMYSDEYDAWIDESEIRTGMEWETEIYNRLLVSDVLVVAIGPGTSESEWVKREIALARALGIAVFPVGYDMTKDEFGNELRALSIGHIQGRLTSNIRIPHRDALLAEIGGGLKLAAHTTAEQQKTVLAPLLSRRNPEVPKARDQQRAFSISGRFGQATIDVHVAAGDFTRTKGIDILVNSENDYMQMARFFESRTVSSLLRRHGARIDDNGKYVDAIQQELDLQLGNRGRPVLAGEVFVTSTGVPHSRLATDNKSRYIFHVAAVQAIDAQAQVVPFSQPDQIEDCMRACFKKLRELNEANGIVSPPGTLQRAEQEEVAQNGNAVAKTILFPLFGTGQGGSSTADAIGHMLESMCRFLSDPDNADLANEVTDIFFSAFREPDVECVKQALTARFS